MSVVLCDFGRFWVILLDFDVFMIAMGSKLGSPSEDVVSNAIIHTTNVAPAFE